MIVLGCRSLKSKRRNTRWVWQVLSLCALAVGAACSGQSASAPSPVPTEATAASATPVTTTTVGLRTVPLPLVDEDEDEDVGVRVRFIAYGDVDPNDDIAFGVIPDLQIAVINDDESSEWWHKIGGDKFGEQPPRARVYIPPGAQVHSTAEDIAASPIDFVTTGPDGTAEAYLEPSEYFSVCVFSPVDSLIAGCSLRETTGSWRDMVFYIYFSHGRAYIDRDPDGSERYYQFVHGDWNSYSPSGEPATITFVSTGYADEYSGYGFIGRFLTSGASVVIIDDTDIGIWWEAVSDFRKAGFYSQRYSLLVKDGPFGWKMPYGYAAREVTYENTVSTGPIGTIEVDLAPGNYLFCHITGQSILGCCYEDTAAGRDYIFEVDYGISKLSDNEGKQLLEDAEDWEIRPS